MGVILSGFCCSRVDALLDAAWLEHQIGRVVRDAALTSCSVVRGFHDKRREHAAQKMPWPYRFPLDTRSVGRWTHVFCLGLRTCFFLRGIPIVIERDVSGFVNWLHGSRKIARTEFDQRPKIPARFWNHNGHVQEVLLLGDHS